MLEDILLNRKRGNPSNSHLIGINYVQQIKQKNNMIDTWYKENPNITKFTYHNYNNSIHSRNDTIYTNKNLTQELFSSHTKNKIW